VALQPGDLQASKNLPFSHNRPKFAIHVPNRGQISYSQAVPILGFGAGLWALW
jgi:hypothetical protein